MVRVAEVAMGFRGGDGAGLRIVLFLVAFGADFFVLFYVSREALEGGGLPATVPGCLGILLILICLHCLLFQFARFCCWIYLTRLV